MALALIVPTGCPLKVSSSSSEVCEPEARELAPGESVRGHDPEKLTEPAWSSWSGLLTWEEGSTSRATLAIEREDDEPFHDSCGAPASAYVYASANLNAEGGMGDQFRVATLVFDEP